MAPDQPILTYLQLSGPDRRAIERLLPPAERRALRAKVRAHLSAQQHARRRSANPAARLKCSPALAKHLVGIAETSGASVTDKARLAVRAALAQHARDT